MIIQAHVTSDSSLLRATCENRLRPLRCQGGLCRTEARAQCSMWRAFAVIVNSCDMQSGSAIAGDRGIKALLWSRAGEISSSTLLDARLPPGPGIAALGGCACRSRAVEPDHAPTSKGWEHDLLPCAVPGTHARLSLKPRISHGSSATCKPSRPPT